MKLSKLIQELEQAKATVGDVEVLIADMEGWEHPSNDVGVVVWRGRAVLFSPDALSGAESAVSAFDAALARDGGA